MRLIFVYNADSGLINTLVGGMHKIVNPSAYDCQLCAITFGNFSENKTWKNFKENSGIEMEFYHRDEFLSKFKSKWLPKFQFPTVLFDNNGELGLFLSNDRLNKMKKPESLIEAIKAGLQIDR